MTKSHTHTQQMTACCQKQCLTAVWGVCTISSARKWKAGRGGRGGGYRGSELMQMGGAGSSRGITSKAFGAEEQTLCRSTNCWRPGVAAGMKKWEGGGMLTIMISDANPGISPPAPPHEETGYYQPTTGSNILSRTANQRGDRGHFRRVTSAHKNTRKKMGKGRWRLHQVEKTLGLGCSVWSVIKGGNVKGFKIVKWGRARVSWDLIALGEALALAVK